MLTALADEPGATGLLALQELGDLALQSGDFAGAVDAYDKLLAKAPANVDARMALLDALEGPQRRGRRQGAGARPGAGREAEDRAQGRRDAAAPRRGAGRDVPVRRRRQGSLRRQAHAGDGRRQGRGRGARARRRQARRSRGGAVPARARLRQPRGRQEGRRAQGVEEGGARQGGGAGARRRRLRGRRSRRGGQAAARAPPRSTPRYQAAYYQLGLVYKEQGETRRRRARRGDGVAHRSEERARQVGVDEAAGAHRQRERVRRRAGHRLVVGDRHRPGDRQAGHRALGPDERSGARGSAQQDPEAARPPSPIGPSASCATRSCSSTCR